MNLIIMGAIGAVGVVLFFGVFLWYANKNIPEGARLK